MKKLLLFLFVICITLNAMSANWGMWSATRSYIVFTVKSTTGVTKSLWDNSVGNFQNTDFGEFTSSETFKITGFDVKTWKSSGGDVTGCEYFYTIYQSGQRPLTPTFISLGGQWLEDLGSGNQKWGKTGINFDLLSGLISGGNYTIEVYGQVSGTGDPASPQYDNNSGANFTATFTFRKNITSANSGNWSVTSSWDNGAIPNSFDNVTINHNVTINQAGNCNNLIINDEKVLTINTLQSLSVTGSLTNSAGVSGLILESGASLIQSSASVSANVKRTINGWSDAAHGWHYLSSPVAAQAISTAFTTTTASEYDFYAWWEPTNQWVNFKNSSIAPTWSTANVINGSGGNTNFLPGKGYLVAYMNSSTKEFSGTLNKDQIVVSNLPISSGTNKGWHLLGNPFPCALTWSGLTLTNINATGKVWRESDASWVDITASGTYQYIPALNGFMVQVTTGQSGNNSVTIPLAARTHNSTSWYKSTPEPTIQLLAHDPSGKTAQESVIRFISGSTVAFDPEYDGHFLKGYAPEFYSLSGDEHLSTNTLPELNSQTQIPFNFIKNEATNFTIEALSITGIPGSVILTDLKTSATQDLTVNPVYSFTAASGDNPARFMISFSHLGLGDKTTDKSFNIYTFNNTILVNHNSGRISGIVEVYNMLGQKVASTGLSGTTANITLSSPTGYYLVKVVTPEATQTAKVFVK
jgi:hypothetical protein